jgi:multidrug efflux system outer membrane protein
MAYSAMRLASLALSFTLLTNASGSIAFALQAPTPEVIKADAQWEESVPTAGVEKPDLNGEESVSAQTATGRKVFEPHYMTRLSADFPEKEWWRQFNDEALAQYIIDALRDSPRLEASLQRIQQSRAQVTQAFAKQLPTLNFTPGYFRLGLPSSIGGGALGSSIQAFLLSFQPAYQLDLFGQNANRTKSAKTELKAVELDSRALLIAVQGEVATAYFNLLRADTSVRTQENNLTLLKRINALKRSQRDAGLTMYDEVIRSERDVAQALTNLNIYRQQQAIFAHQLAILTGRPAQAESHLRRSTLDQMQLPAITPSGNPADLLTRRPDIVAQETRLQRAAIDVKIARKEFLPKINLSAFFSTAGSKIGDVVKKDDFADLELAQATQPVFQGGRLVGESRYQKARQREQVANYRQTVLSALKEVEDQLALLKTSYDILNSNSQRLTLTQDSLKITQDQQQQGLVPKLNVLQAQSELIQYQQLSAQSKSDAAIATVNLYKALGGGF